MTDERELTSRILSILEDVGWDDIHAILNTIVDPTGVPGEVELFEKAIQDFLDRGLGTLSLRAINPAKVIPLDQQQVKALLLDFGSWFRFDREGRFWTLGNGDMLKDPAPVLTLTDKGVAAAQEVLQRLGYDWWRQTK